MPMLVFMHMTTHAMFKALLFISAGCLISMNHHNQDMRLYSQYSNMSPITSSSMMISVMALMGMPFMTGYYSKHSIMEWSNNMLINSMTLSFMLLTIFLTSIYSLRLLLMLTMFSMKQPLFTHKYSMNNNLPLMIMSIMSITLGSMLQWLMPMSPISIQMSEKYMNMFMNSLIILSINIVLFIKFMKMQAMWNMKLTKLNKMLSSTMFITLMSTQFLLPKMFKSSLYLYKYLDQSWLEKLISMGLQQSMTNMGSKMNKMLHITSQKIVMTTFTSSTILLLCIM